MRDELDILYRRFAFTVHQRCLSMLGNPDDAQEVTQEVFLKVLEMPEVDIHAPSSLFYVIATRLCLNRLRQKKTRRTSPQSALLDQIAAWGPSPEDTSGARELLAKLFRPQAEMTRVIAVLHHLDGLTLEETAKEVQASVSTVRRRLRTVRADLKLLEDA